MGTAVAYQIALAFTVSTFNFALAWDVLFLAERSDALALAGTALIVAVGVRAVRRHAGRRTSR